jgi:hypothetical protein
VREAAESLTKADPLRTFAATVADPWTAHRDRTDAGHDLVLGQIAMAHQPVAAVGSQLVGMRTSKAAT